ncbi:hypothetical protein G6F65_020680 [Rhizopus arrhizus]|nr:hypothetical protein G6F65_020680 [Rhizopus arrhizus]KAG1391292.1 hypothetical protein G6F59_014938 [Rhizopus arrhizus]
MTFEVTLEEWLPAPSGDHGHRGAGDDDERPDSRGRQDTYQVAAQVAACQCAGQHAQGGRPIYGALNDKDNDRRGGDKRSQQVLQRLDGA